ncbi:MAG: hypothetical protein ACKOYJ_08630 [Planctomycetia bacterium]
MVEKPFPDLLRNRQLCIPAAAARFYSLCSDHELTRLNQERCAAAPTYWEEDVRCYQAPGE